MTNWEAIQVLKGLKKYYNDKRYNGFYAGFDVEDNEALDMAINKLEEIEDCISREAALNRACIIIDEDGIIHKMVSVGAIKTLPSIKPR